ncbi:hypothetical protein GIB67_007824 [Kingdonia uniflora]|uniref:C2H2-type domain-containing protein n=1 Tax=Kingdonia uniflora TaxID=39325 RepID=A0A7J7N218_9MAGN|nr:hypothetical protein GIB67_007824 [Kingdonia uniflora]
MEQARYWMWARRKVGEKPHLQASITSEESWEEQAFAEDSSGLLGGCIWPPRSYSCSFCRREFRSAQALGGHMNVHRRDRARLKQSPTPNSNEVLLQHHNPSQVCRLDFDSNPSATASPLLPSRVSALAENTLVSPSYSSTIAQEHQKGSLFSSPSEHHDTCAVRFHTFSDLKKLDGEKNSRASEKEKPDSTMSLSFVVHRNNSTGLARDDDEGMSNSKRQRIDAAPLPFYLKSSSDVLGLGQSSMEELDLELRLGDRPEVK